MPTLKNIFITGANGFIGRNLKEYFLNNHNVFAPARDELNLLDDQAIRRYVIANRINFIIHCANIGGGRDTLEVQDVVGTNLKMFFNIARNSDLVETIIHFGSGAEYDIYHYHPKMEEAYFGTYIPNDDYGFSKYVCSKYILGSQKNIYCLRLFGVFGKYEKYHLKFISNAIVKNLFNLPIIIKQNTRFSYLYIEDLLKVVSLFLSNPPTEKVFNIVPYEVIDLVSIANFVNLCGSHQSEIKILNDGFGLEYSGSSTKLLAAFPSLLFPPLEESIKKLYDWYQAHLSMIDQNLLKEGDALISYSRTSKP